MVQWDSTRTERMARLKEHLEGVSPRRGMPTKAGTGGNLLWGLTLHTAAKLDAGQKLSDLEVLLGGGENPAARGRGEGDGPRLGAGPLRRCDAAVPERPLRSWR